MTDESLPAAARNVGWGRRRILLAAVIVLITAAAYVPAMRAGYIWDDDLALTGNLFVRSVSGLSGIWFTTQSSDYFPLTTTSFWLEWRLWGMNPAGYHVTNVLLHAAGAVLIWIVLRRLAVPGALAAALIFAVHPVNVASVAWITERKNTLSLLFYLLTILCYLAFDGERRRRWYFASLFAFLLALLSKSSVVTLPFVLLGCVWWRRRKLGAKDALNVAPFFALSLIMGLVTIWFQTHRALGDIGGGEGVGLLTRAAAAGRAVWFYLYKALLPLHVSMIYPRLEIRDISLITLLPGIALVALFGIFWWRRKSWGRPLLFGMGYFVVTLAPTLGFFRTYFTTYYSGAADHWQYVSLIGVIALAVGLVSHASDSWTVGVRGAAAGCAVALIVALCALTWMTCEAYRNRESVWRHTIMENPQAWVAHEDLGLILANRGRAQAGACSIEKALRLEPSVPRVHYNMGYALARAGRMDESIAEYRRAVELNPAYADAHSGLAAILFTKGRRDEAVAECREALRIDPEHVNARHNLEAALSGRGKPSDSIAACMEAVRRNPEDADAHNRLGSAYYRQRRMSEAADEFRKAARLMPESSIPWSNLALALKALGKGEEAAAALVEAERRESKKR